MAGVSLTPFLSASSSHAFSSDAVASTSPLDQRCHPPPIKTAPATAPQPIGSHNGEIFVENGTCPVSKELSVGMWDVREVINLMAPDI